MNEPRHTDNAPGSWYVNEECICCHICEENAPAHFRESEDGDHHIVYNQPQTEDELIAAEEAKEGCPVDAIHSDNVD